LKCPCTKSGEQYPRTRASRYYANVANQRAVATGAHELLAAPIPMLAVRRRTNAATDLTWIHELMGGAAQLLSNRVWEV